MKKFSRVIALILCVMMLIGMLPSGVFAAEEGVTIDTTGLKPGPNVIADPESPTGYTVKFLYQNDTAKEVTFAGDIALRDWAADTTRNKGVKTSPFDYKPGMMRCFSYTDAMVKLTEGEYAGWWYYELPLAAGANQYWFYVDGNTNYMVPDPNNMPAWSPRSNVNTKNAYNAVYVPYDEKQDYEPMKAREAENPRTDGKVGTWSYVQLEYTTGAKHWAGVYLPYGYDENRAEPYKTIYMLHGFGQDESDWMGIGSVQKIMDNLAAEGRTEPAVIVSVTSDNGMISSGGGFFGGGSFGIVETELIPAIEKLYNVSDKAEDRAWMGLSMGSMNTQNMINANAPLFGYYGAFSGGLSVRATTAGLDKTHIVIGYGSDDSTVALSDSVITGVQGINDAGGHAAFEYVCGGHDFNAWCQLFRIMCEDYLWNPAAFGDVEPLEDIDFTDPASADRFEIENQASTEIREGEGLYMISTKDVFEPEGTPKDVVKIPVGEEDWTATVQMKVNTGSGWGWGKSGELFGFYAMDDYNNFAGIRAAMNNMQDIVRKDGEITAGTQNKTPGLSSYNNATIFLRIVKTGDDYACAISTDGGYDYTDLFTLEDTGINGGIICLDAYSTNSVGYNYLLKNISFAEAKPNCEHEYALDASSVAVTCTTNGTNVFVCPKCGKSYTENVTAPGHIWDEGVVTLEPTETEFGAKLYTCTVCGETKEGKILPTNVKLGPTLVEDPESPTGYTAKFVYFNDTAKQVYFCGDLMLGNHADPTDTKTYDPSEYKPGLMRRGGSQYKKPMENLGSGYWYYELPLCAGANQYWFNIDNNSRMQPDPANHPIWSPNSNENSKDAYNCLYVPYCEKQNYEPLAARVAELPRESADKGTWSYVPYEIDGKTFYMAVYLPYGYDAERAEPYKTIYLIHGSGQDESDWMGIGSAQNIMDNLVAEGRTEAAVLVSLSLNNGAIGDQNSKFANLFNVVLPFVEENYNVSKEAADRSVSGLSMGSRYSKYIMETDALAFGYYGLYSCMETIKMETPNLDKAHIFVGVGQFEASNYVNATNTNINNLEAADSFYAFERVAGAHDFNTWDQLLRIYIEEYLWKPWKFGDGEEPTDPYADLQPGPNVIADPESPTGYTVKFLYENETANSVTFAGDIALRNWADLTDTTQYTPWEYQPGMMRSGSYTAEMEKLTEGKYAGWWYYELPLAAGANQYWFYVNGSTRRMMPDPNNAPIWSPNSSASKNAYNAVYVPYDEKQDFEPLAARAAELPRAEGDQKGTWSYVPIEINGATKYMGVYLPYGFDAEREEPYKTIYAVHGGGQDESDWMGIGSVQNIMDNLVAEGKTEPAIIVTPASSYFGSNFSNLFNIIIPYVEATYNASAEPADRTFCGLSAGGGQTRTMINSFGDQFGYYGPWSSSNTNDGYAAAKNLENAHIMFGVGEFDPLTARHATPETIAELEAKGAYVVYEVVAGAHDFNSWCQLFRIFLEDYAWNPAAFGDTGAALEDIDFTDPASADRFEVENAESTVIREGEGLYMISTKDVFEPEGTPKDVVKIPVGEEDWTATVQIKVNTGSGWGWGKSGELFGFYAMDDYNNFAGIRAAMNNMQDIVRKDGEITAGTQNKTPGLSSYNNKTIFLRIVKTGDDYACAISTDGGYDYTDLFTLEDTGINGGIICLDAYSTNSVGYNYLINNISFAEAKPNCEHEYALDDSSVAVTCTTAGTNVFVCSKCGKSYTETVRAPGHTRNEGVVTAPTCTEAGFTTFICTVCGETFTGDNVAALGHSWDEGVVTLEPTETEFGTKFYTCTVCDATKETKILPTAMKLGPTVVADPESPTGYTVKFVYFNETAKTVTFAGDIGLINWADRTDTKQYTPWEYKPGLMRSGSYTAPMEDLGDGYWYYELPLAAGANQYWFYVNGNNSRMMPDPNNAPIWSPNSSANKNAYNAVYVPYDEKQDYEPMKARIAENPRTDGQTGTWSYVPVVVSGRTLYMGVYLPYGYDADRAEPYKTIYTLHGGGQDESDWMGIGSVQNIMDNLAAEGRTEPAIIVTPTTNNGQIGNASNKYANLFNIIIPFIEENYNVSSEPEDRAFCGLSMGCTYSQEIANIAADQFGYFGPWSNSIVLDANADIHKTTHFFFGRGVSDTGAAGNMRAQLEAIDDLYCVYEEVAGAHDFNTWCQLYRMFLEDYLWKPAAFGDLGGLDLGPTVIADPESPTGYTVKFLYFNDEVDSVTFCGDLMLSNYADPSDNKLYTPFEYKPGMMRRGNRVFASNSGFSAPMENIGGGYWYYELPLTAGANQYWFTLPGDSRMQPDPANHPIWSPASNWNTKNAYNAVYVPYDEKQDYAPLAAREIENPREGQNNGTWSYVPYTVGNADYYMGVYLPYGYDAEREEPYKTVYVLHGGGQDESDWLGIGSVQNIIDNLYADGRIEDAPILIVPGTGNNRLRNANLEATFAFVEQNYNVSTDYNDRAVCGLSAGSMMANSIIGDDKNREEPAFAFYGLFSGGQPSSITGSKHINDVYLYTANGLYEGGTYSQSIWDAGAYYHTYQVAGAHDFNTWCQLFTDFVENYAFQPEKFERKEISPFADVSVDAYYYKAVKWAVDNNITNGFEPGLFAPDNAVTRAQIVTMLWRAAGCPAPAAAATFKDVKAGEYYADAVAWAVENGITNGVGKNMFAPNDVCTRGQIVTFLWRYMGKPAAEADVEFSDVPADEYYADAIAWAVEAGVTEGYPEGIFKPIAECTRAQAVTFLQRAIA